MKNKTLCLLLIMFALTTANIYTTPSIAQANTTIATNIPTGNFAEWTFDNGSENWQSIGFKQEAANGMVSLTILPPFPTLSSRFFRPHFFVNETFNLTEGLRYFNMIITIRTNERNLANATPFQHFGLKYQRTDGSWSEEQVMELYQEYPGQTLRISLPLDVSKDQEIKQVRLTALFPNTIGAIFDVDYIAFSETPLEVK